MSMSTMLDLKTAALLLGVSRAMVRKMIQDGRIKAVVLGKRTYRIPSTELEKLCAPR